MRRRILETVTLTTLSRDRRLAYFAPSGGFWSLWRNDKATVKSLNFAPIKTEDGWRVRWCGEAGEINASLFASDGEPVDRRKILGISSSEHSNCPLRPLEYQIAAIDRLCAVLEARKSAIDASDTGIGKTYVAAFVAKRMGLKPIVICPKSAIGTWRKALLGVGFAADDVFIGNYERWVRGNCYEYYDLWRFRGTREHLTIVDEVHRCRNAGTKNAKLPAKIYQSDSKLLLLSATAFENPEKSDTIAAALGLCPDTHGGRRLWIVQHGCFPNKFGGERLKFHGDRKHLVKMHREIFPTCGIRLRIADIPGFPDCRHIVDPITLDGDVTQRISTSLQNVQTLQEQLRSLKECDIRGKVLAKIQRERREVEMHKLPTMRQMADDLIAEGRSVAIFLNFQASMDRLRAIYGPRAAYVHGNQALEERERAIASFQSDRIPLIILNIEAGGSSISLHDIHGRRRRHSLISPNWSAVTFKQVLGRIHRSGARSPAIQRVVLVDGTVEVTIAARLQTKLRAIATINDGDLQ